MRFTLKLPSHIIYNEFRFLFSEIRQGAILVEVLLFTCFKPALQINEASLDLKLLLRENVSTSRKLLL